jgi:hypothetical protein
MLAMLAVQAVTSGCALVPIPCPLELTGPINGVRILDSQTELPVPDAKLTFTTAPSSLNWGHGAPEVILSGEPPAADADECRRQPDGTFAIESRRRFVTCRPWGIGPLGCCLYEGPRAVFNVWAPGYHTLDGGWTIDYRRRSSAAQDSGPSRSEARQSDLDGDGILRVYLERDAAVDWSLLPR